MEVHFYEWVGCNEHGSLFIKDDATLVFRPANHFPNGPTLLITDEIVPLD